MKTIKTCIFDLDGVIVDTAKYHYQAWRRLANELGFDFTEEENEKLKGVSRTESLDLILKWGKMELAANTKLELAEKKNSWYQEFIEKMTPAEILKGVMPFLQELKARQIKIALGSASKNAPLIMEQIGLTSYFDAIIDGNQVVHSKPNPEVFLKGAAATGAQPDQCIVFEDAEKGIEAALNGGFWAVGIGAEEVLGQAHLVIPSFVGWTFDQLLDRLGASQKAAG